MSKKFVILKALCLIGFLTSCGSLMNMTYDQHEHFKELRNKEIGRSIEEPLSKIPESWRPSVLKIVEIDDQNTEYRFSYSKCSWASSIDPKTNVITGWRFIGEPKECKSRKYYQGPW